MSKFLNISTNTNLGSSDSQVSSQNAVKTYVDNGLSEKQDTLVSGTNIKTINNNSILGSGNISISATPDNSSISLNSDDELQTIGVIDTKTSGTNKVWTGTLAEYTALASKDANTYYTITDDETGGTSVYTKTEVDALIATKQATLVSGTNIKTINNNSILGSGNISISGGVTQPLLSTIWSDHLIEDMSWLRADSFSWNNGTTYSTVYNELLSEYNNASSTAGVDYNYVDFEQPILSANGTLGGSSFAVACNTELSGTASTYTFGTAYLAFDSSADTAWHGAQSVFPATLTFYNPNKLKVTELIIKNWSIPTSYTSSTGTGMGTGVVEASNDNSTWVQLGTFSNANIYPLGVWSIDLSSNTGYYQYYRITCNSADYGYAVAGNVHIVAREQVTTNAITYKRTPKGYKIALANQETNVAYKYSNRGIAWYYILDTTNTQFKLPRTKYGLEGLRDYAGDDIEESLPNISGRLYNWGGRSTAFSGYENYALYCESANIGSLPTENQYNSSFNSLYNVHLDASRSSSTYQDNAPVQESATQMYLYFYVGEYSRSALEQSAGITAETLASKQDLLVSGTNIKTVNNTSIVGSGNIVLPNPDYTNAVTLSIEGTSLTTSGVTYTATANGWVYFHIYSDTVNNTACTVYINGVYLCAEVSRIAIKMNSFLPVSQGDVVSIIPTGTGWNIYKATFIPQK